MKHDTIAALNQLNRRFYRQTASEFDASRRSAWAGWKLLLPHLPQTNGIKILDLGCGNGRFGRFLAENGIEIRDYVGIDTASELLARAEKNMDGIPHRLIQGDVEMPDNNGNKVGTFDLVVAFGVIHHIFTQAQRQAVLAQWSSRVNPGGLLIVSFWQFLNDKKRFEKHLVSWESLSAAQINIPADELEPGDYLLDWNQHSEFVRYCHHFSHQEIERLSRIPGTTLVHKYSADGKTGDLNRYLVWQKN